MTFTVGGLPAHPLIVHAVVVLIPLSALGAVAVAIRAGWNRPYAPLVAAGAVASAITATMAELAGDALLATINVSPAYVALLDEHGRFGVYTVYASWIFAVVGLVALVLVVITGDLGATSVWGTVG